MLSTLRIMNQISEKRKIETLKMLKEWKQGK